MADRAGDLSSVGRIGFIGAGAAGSTLARMLAARDARITALATRHPQTTHALAAALPGPPAVGTPTDVVAATDLVFLAVPDDAITELATGLPWHAGQAAVHLSGAKPAAALAPAATRGARIAALHPM